MGWVWVMVMVTIGVRQWVSCCMCSHEKQGLMNRLPTRLWAWNDATWLWRILPSWTRGDDGADDDDASEYGSDGGDDVENGSGGWRVRGSLSDG